MLAHEARHHEAAEGAGRQEHDLAVFEVRRHRPRDVGLGECRRRQDDQLGAGDRGADIGSGAAERDLAPAALVDEDDRAGVDDG